MESMLVLGEIPAALEVKSASITKTQPILILYADNPGKTACRNSCISR